jgi:hypothetical protein
LPPKSSAGVTISNPLNICMFSVLFNTTESKTFSKVFESPTMLFGSLTTPPPSPGVIKSNFLFITLSVAFFTASSILKSPAT